MQPGHVWVDGAVLPGEGAHLSVFDRGFLFGDSVYETLRTYHGVPFLLDRHLARLERSAQRLAFELPSGVGAQVEKTHAAAGAGEESALRIIVTRGRRRTTTTCG